MKKVYIRGSALGSKKGQVLEQSLIASTKTEWRKQ